MPKVMEIKQFNRDAHTVLSKTQPKLLEVIKQAIEMNQTPAQIEKFVARRCQKYSVIPGLCRGAAEYLYTAKSN